ncbi:PREDICTED: putative F-box protein At1g50870 [Camelina sativa]|uniref:F-box protein At1g50870 n=1 Tax=Camelina sativa TaxID=90675 RepID=A0ABM1Q7B7_CAMSA|nr:PREDICTED: putative F-box protein At1g50870 [Camelina sativa]
MTESTSSSSLPIELTTAILLKLPAESVVRSRYVSKHWSSITTDTYFTNTFETRSSARPSLLMFFKNKDKVFVFSFPQHDKNTKPHSYSYHVDSYHMKYPTGCNFSVSESVHGLICFRKLANPVIWNPSTRQFLTLTKPIEEFRYGLIVFLGYDPIEGKHKVVCMPASEASDECRVLTLGSAEKSWRTVKTNYKHRAYYRSSGRCINGVLYYNASYLDEDSDIFVVMSFDVRTEKFDMIRFPFEDFWGNLITYKGRLACLDSTNLMENDDGVTMWILMDAEQSQWSCKHFLTPFTRRLKKVYKIYCVTDAGEFIYVIRTFLKSFVILYFDPERNSLRRVEFKGIADEDFRFKNGLGNKRLCTLFSFPNHVETLMSL